MDANLSDATPNASPDAPQPELAGIPPSPAPDVQPDSPVSHAAIDLIDVQERASLASQDAPYGLTQDGRPAKKRGRKPGQARAETPAAAPAAAPLPPPVPKVDFQLMARGITNAEISLLVAFLGKDWEPSSELKDAQALRDAWAGFLEAKGVQAFPPEVLLIMAHVAYASPRLTTDSTRSRLARVSQWGKSLFKRTVRKDAPLTE